MGFLIASQAAVACGSADEGENTEESSTDTDTAGQNGGTVDSDTEPQTVNVFFTDPGSYFAGNLADQAVINLGLNKDEAPQASTGRADFDQVSSTDLTLNIHAYIEGLELDYKQGVHPEVDINLVIKISETIGNSEQISFDLHAIPELTINQLGTGDVTLLGGLDLNSQTESLAITKAPQSGDFFLGLDATGASIINGESLETLSITAADGRLILQNLDPSDTSGNYNFIDDITALQSYSVQSDGTDITIGNMGRAGDALDLETLEFSATRSGTIDHYELNSDPSKIAEMRVSSTGNNSINKLYTFVSPLNGNHNIVLDDLRATYVAYQEINANDGGHILLRNQNYVAGEQVFTGSGNIAIGAISPPLFLGFGYAQTEAADASQHSGERLFMDGQGVDIFFGSTADDTIVFQAFNSSLTQVGGTYFDSGGDDVINIIGDDLIVIYDGNAGSNDLVDIIRTGFTQRIRLEFNVGSGDDEIQMAPPGFSQGATDRVLIDFGARVSGTLEIENLVVPTHQLSFDGLTGISASQTMPLVASGTGIGVLNDNSIYLIEDGDTPVFGSSIASYLNLNDVAGFLSSGLSGSMSPDDSVIFIIHNQTSSAAVGDNQDVYFYHFREQQSAGSISGDELTLLGSATLFPGLGATTPPMIADTSIV